jgi:hypothetical protein
MSDQMQAQPDGPEPLGPPERELRDALVARFGATPVAAVDWEAQARRIAEAARFRLAERSRRGWQRPAARWARFAIPAGLAAGVLLAVGAALGPVGGGADLEDPGMREVAAVAAADSMSADPLTVTDQELALSVLLSEER